MTPYPPSRVIAVAITALIALSYAAGPEALAQAGPRKRVRADAASRQTRSQPKEENEKARELMEAGLRRADQEDWAGALDALKQTLDVSPRYGDAYVALGDTYMNMGRYEEGFKAYRQAINVTPSNPDAHYSLGAAYNDMGQYGDAFRHFVQAIRLDPDFAEAHYGIGYAYFKLENFKGALVYLRRAAQLRPDYWEAYLTLGQAYLGLRDVKAAERELKTLAGLNASAAGELEKEIRTARGVADPPDRTELDGRSESVTPLGEKSVTINTARGESVVGPARPAARNQSATPATSPVAAPRPAASGGDSGLAVELLFWESVKNSGNTDEFAAYLNKYPQGQFAELARIRMRALASKKAEALSENTKPKQQVSANNDNTAAPVNQSKPVSQTPARDGFAQRPKEQLSEEQPAEDQPAKEPPVKEKELP